MLIRELLTAIQDTDSEEEMLRTLQKARQHVIKSEGGYPPVEVEWLVCTAWNQGVSYANDGKCCDADPWCASHRLFKRDRRSPRTLLTAGLGGAGCQSLWVCWTTCRRRSRRSASVRCRPSSRTCSASARPDSHATAQDDLVSHAGGSSQTARGQQPLQRCSVSPAMATGGSAHDRNASAS